ncbi:glycosyltransferase family 4 protein [Parabacteroides bouchesdurhonensis]|uniref:glycosyltransferase family 4 protein n=1 Tax=Parabacteroides bouchesdurhonensis TaxID=1936995 RepID=UPI000E4726AF|nr:glycosyltransferase family 1 protein [Parabacteroides bouchesdurhonensis]RHJ90404.1 glycosyltransferase family 1 protein [Bacteroides sp. AM07-16]
MKIAIEAQRIFRANKHGMDFVALESIRELQKIDHDNEYFIFVSSGEDHCLQESNNFHIIELRCPTYPLWEQVALPRAIAKIKPDLLHCTSNTAPLYCSVPLVLTLHDIIFLEPRQSGNKSVYQNMGWYYRRFVVPRILPHCRKIITVSKFERNRIKNALQLPEEQIITVYNGYSPYFFPRENAYSITQKYIQDKSYIFFLGNTDPKKNVPKTLKAYQLYRKHSENPLPLLIADIKETILNAIIKEENIEEIRPYIICSGYIPNTDLPYIYSGAFAFLYTSLRESFGIPLLEAMACGTPVVTSNTSSMPEVAGNEALLSDPSKADDIAEKLLLLEKNQDLYQQQIEYGLKRVKAFSWKETAQGLLSIYCNLQTTRS